MYKALALVLIISCSIRLQAQTSNGTMKVTDLLQVKSVTGVSLSKDGSRVAYTVTAIEPDGDSKVEYKYVNQIWLVNTDGKSAARQLTNKEGSAQPVFSPDGAQLAFVRTGDNGKPQVFILPLNTGGEAMQLTKSKYGAGNPKWSPDGKQILFTSGITLKEFLKDSVLNPGKEVPAWPYEKPGFPKNENLRASSAKADPDGNMDEVRAYLENDVTDRKARVMDKLNFQDEMDVSGDMSFSHVFIQSVNGDGKAKALTFGFNRFSAADFTPDGKQIVLAGDIDSLQHPDRSLESEIFIVNTDGSGFRKLLGEEGKSYNAPQVSPTGKWLSFQYGATSFVSIPTLAIMPLNGTAKDIIDIPMDRTKSGYNWSADEKYLYFTAQSNGGAPLYRLNIATKKVEQLTDVNSGIGAYDLAGNKLVFVKTEVASPFELYTADADAKNAVRLSNLNTTWLSSKKLVMPEKHSFVNEKGMTIEYWVMKPANYEPGKKFPLLLEIHGGPSAMWGPGESSMWHEFQYFCSKGYGVVYSNPRGSGGYGLDFLRGNVNDWGTGPTKDVLTALDKTVAEGWADTSKLLVTGGSYAGYLVAWIIAHDHRFKAACSQRGVYDLATFFGEGNAWRLVPNYFGGYPWEPATKAILQRESPITYVQNITTPYIIFHGDNDRRTGFVGGEMMYRSLKVLGRPVEYVRHPGGTHELTRSGNNRQRIDQMLRTWEFFERWMH